MGVSKNQKEKLLFTHLRIGTKIHLDDFSQFPIMIFSKYRDKKDAFFNRVKNRLPAN